MQVLDSYVFKSENFLLPFLTPYPLPLPSKGMLPCLFTTGTKTDFKDQGYPSCKLHLRHVSGQ